jgi:hypothetical protein
LEQLPKQTATIIISTKEITTLSMEFDFFMMNILFVTN